MAKLRSWEDDRKNIVSRFSPQHRFNCHYGKADRPRTVEEVVDSETTKIRLDPVHYLNWDPDAFQRDAKGKMTLLTQNAQDLKLAIF